MSYQREFEDRVRIGVVGIGSHCYRNLLPTLTYLPVRLEAFCDLNEALLEKTAPQYGVKRCYTSTAEMYRDGGLDAVLLCVGPRHHPRLTVEALEAGLHVWMEKPPSMRASELDAAIEKRGDRVVVVGFKKAFMPGIQKAQGLLSSGEAGVLKSMLAEYPMEIPEDGGRVLESGETTNWLANGCHPLSAMRVVGGPVARVATHRSRHEGGALILEFASGAVGTLHLSSGMRGATERYSFFAEHAHVVVENALRVLLHRGIPFHYGRTVDFAPAGTDSGTVVWEPQNNLATLENKALFTQGFYNELSYFLQCVQEKRPAALGTLEFAREIMEIYEAALFSDGSYVQV